MQGRGGGCKSFHQWWCVTPGVAIMVSTVIVALLQLGTLNYALSKFRASHVVPIILATLTVTGTTLGATYFEEYKRFTRGSWLMMPSGIAAAVLGIVFLTVTATPSESDQTSRNPR